MNDPMTCPECGANVPPSVQMRSGRPSRPDHSPIDWRPPIELGTCPDCSADLRREPEADDPGWQPAA